MHTKLRIGTLGAARITPLALIYPAREIPEIEVVAVAARDPKRAKKFAHRYAIPNVFDDYENAYHQNCNPWCPDLVGRSHQLVGDLLTKSGHHGLQFW